MTSLGLTFHSQPTPALCIQTSFATLAISRCPSLFLLRTFFRSFPLFVPVRYIAVFGRFLSLEKGRKGKKKKNDSSKEVVQGKQPLIGWREGTPAMG